MTLTELIIKYQPKHIQVLTDSDGGKYFTRISLVGGVVPSGEAHFLAHGANSYEESFNNILEQINKIPS